MSSADESGTELGVTVGAGLSMTGEYMVTP
jgi:hypothetical protein